MHIINRVVKTQMLFSWEYSQIETHDFLIEKHAKQFCCRKSPENYWCGWMSIAITPPLTDSEQFKEV